jgi:hypothetical protein
MTERTRSGEPYKYIKPSDIVRMLDGDPGAGAVLALCCAERLSKIAEGLAPSSAVGRSVRAGLDLGWSVATVRDGSAEAVSKAISDLSELLSPPDGDAEKIGDDLDDAICAAIYALEAVNEGSRMGVLNAVSRCRDVYFLLATRTWPTLSLNALRNSPIMQQEVSRELGDARAIAAWEGVISAERIAPLRQAARTEAKILATLVLGGAQEVDEDPAAGGQEPLF